jgi:hypothetical protein
MGGGEVDAAKDKALLDAFSQAIASAMRFRCPPASW